MVAELRRAGFGPDWRRVVTEAEYVDLLGLPSFSAGRALEILRERELRVPFIVVSGTIGEEAAVALMKQGAIDCLLKDRLARLGPAVSQTLEQRRLRAAEHKAQAEVLYQSEKLGAMGQLLAGLAHELFNLLSVGRQDAAWHGATEDRRLTIATGHQGQRITLEVTDLRAVLHDETARPRDRARARALPEHRGAAPRRDLGEERSRPEGDVPSRDPGGCAVGGGREHDETGGVAFSAAVQDSRRGRRAGRGGFAHGDAD